MGLMLETRGLTKRFGRGADAQTAVDGVCLHVEEGRVYGLLGPTAPASRRCSRWSAG